MGCWNGTCGISQMSIPAGEKVKAFLILQSEFCNEICGAGQCYSSAYFRPWFFPVNAEYADYGSIDNIEMDWNAQYMLETFQKWLADGTVRLLGDESEINSPDIETFEKLEDVFRCVERGGLVFHKNKHNNENYLKIGIFMVLPHVYNSLVVCGERHLNEHSYIKEYYEKDFLAARKTVDEARSGAFLDMDSELHQALYFTSIHRLLGDMIQEHAAYHHYAVNLLNPKGFDVDVFFKTRRRVGYIESAMTYLRKYWIPQSGQGSQSEELEFTKALITGMNSFIAQREVQFKEWERENEEFQKKYEAEQKAKNENP